MRIATQRLILVVGQARQDRAALRRGDSAALGDDGGVGDRFGQVGEQLGHRRAGLEPGFGRRGRPVGVFDVGRVGDAQQGVVRVVEARLGVASRVGRDERQVGGVGEVDQRGFGGLLDGIAAARQLDVKAIGEQRLQPRGIGLGGV